MTVWKLPEEYANRKQSAHNAGRGMELGEEMGLRGTGAAGNLLRPVTLVGVFDNTFVVADLDTKEFLEFSRAHGMRMNPPRGWIPWFVDPSDLSAINGAWKTRHPGDYVSA